MELPFYIVENFYANFLEALPEILKGIGFVVGAFLLYYI